MRWIRVVCTHGAAPDARVKGRKITTVTLVPSPMSNVRAKYQRGYAAHPTNPAAFLSDDGKRFWHPITDVESGDERIPGHVLLTDESSIADVDYDWVWRVAYECPAPTCHRRWVARADTWAVAMSTLFDDGYERIDLSELARRRWR